MHFLIPHDKQVLPLSENSNETSDDLVDEKDVKTEVMRARGAGGQVSALSNLSTAIN